MRRFLVLHLPAFRLERCGFTADQMAGLIDESRSANRLVALTPVARAAGLTLGMTAASARALVPEVILEELDSEAEQQDRAALLHFVQALSDQVAFPWPDEIVIDVTQTLGWFGSEQALFEAVDAILEPLGHVFVRVLAFDALLGAAVARWRGQHLVVNSSDLALYEELPLALLQPSESLLRGLLAVGVESLGQLRQLPKVSVASRYGDEGRRFALMSRGEAVTSLQWGAVCEAHPSVRADLAGATTTLQLQFALPGLLTELCELLASRDLAVLRLRLIFRLEVGWGLSQLRRATTVGVRVGRPTRSVSTLTRLIHKRLEEVNLNAPVDEWIIEVAESAPERGWQPGLTDRAEVTEPLPDLIARLSDQLGSQALFSPELVDDWRPEHAWRRASFPPDLSQLLKTQPTAPDPVTTQLSYEQVSPGLRPSRVLPTALQVQVEVKNNIPAAVWCEGRRQAVRRVIGPERLENAWWSKESIRRDYWVVELEDLSTAWVFREGARWALHGFFG